MNLFDTHAHCDDKRIEEEFEGGTDGLIRYCLENGVSNIVNIGTNVENSKRSIELAEKFDEVYATVGIHPYDAMFIPDMETTLSEIEKMLFHKKVVALGEIGLDYHYEPVDKNLQLGWFKAQMALAEKLNVPVVIHDREAHGDCMQIIKEFPNVKGVFHSFSGSAEMAKELIKLGWYISFSGTVTYKNAQKPKEACICVPDDKILIETDSPYLPPTPHRGEMNMPSYVYLTACEIAKLRCQDENDFIEMTNRNAKTFFGIKQ
jgi:TatD DNase family protein